MAPTCPSGQDEAKKQGNKKAHSHIHRSAVTKTSQMRIPLRIMQESSNQDDTGTTITVAAAHGLASQNQHDKPRLTRATKFHPSLQRTLRHFSRSLTPLVSVTTGAAHPLFPPTILAYHLLTSADLDALSLHYHQTSPPTRESFEYPVRVPGWLDRNGKGQGKDKNVELETKRRRFGRFIGLRGCESPTKKSFGDGDEVVEDMERRWEEGLSRVRQGVGKGAWYA